jgi:hypothetical protein
MHWLSFDRVTLLRYNIKLTNFPVEELKDPAGYGAADTRAIVATLKHKHKSKRTKFVKMMKGECKAFATELSEREKREKESRKKKKVIRNAECPAPDTSGSESSGESGSDTEGDTQTSPSPK